MYLFNLFLLASRLPRDAGLSDSLHRFFVAGHRAAGLAADGGRAALQLRQALCNQQTDDRLWGFWPGRLAERGGPWNDARRSELMDAWRGLLWCVDLAGERQAADLPRLSEALVVFHDTVIDQPRGDRLLQHALMRLEQAFPSGLGSPRLTQALRPHWQTWPPALKDGALLVWPALAPRALAQMPPLPPELAELWNVLEPARQRTLLGFLNTGDAQGGGRFLKQDLLFNLPRLTGASPQEVRHRISDLGQRLWPQTAAQGARPVHDPRDWAEDGPGETDQGYAHDRGKALQGIGRALHSIEQRLARGDVAKARAYLDDLVAQQRAQGLSDTHVHLAKTLTNAATLARDQGELDWAEELFRAAMVENRKDVVPACGLADVLKAGGDLGGAEAQYLDNVARWPNDAVSVSGLAEVLKAKGDLDGAEAQYRESVARWPADRVARNGLANVLRSRGRTVDALVLIPDPQGSILTLSDLYDLHLRGLLLSDLGRAPEARAAFDRGLAMAQAPAVRDRFERSLLVLDLRIKQYRTARERLATMPTNVVSLQLFRLHAAAGDGDEGEARGLLTDLRREAGRMSADKRLVLERLEECFCLTGPVGLCQPDDADLDAIFDAEVEMELAA